MITEILKEDQVILEMYARGESYEVIQHNLKHDHGISIGKNKLGKEMGNMKRRYNCATQFELGFKYCLYKFGTEQFFGSHACEKWLEKIRAKAKDQIAEASHQGFEEGVKSVDDRYRLGINKGLNIGVVLASLFWLIIFGIICQNFNIG